MKFSTIKYFITLFFFAAALTAGWWLWNYYMQSPWTRDGKVRAELVSISPQVSGKITQLLVKDNQFVAKGAKLVTLEEEPWRIEVLDAEAALTQARSDLMKAQHEARRRQNLPRNTISAEELDAANLNAEAMASAAKAAEARLARAKWNLSQTQIFAPTDGWVGNLQIRPGNYATSGTPLFALIDSHSFYVTGYFEETKLRHIKPGYRATIRLYSDNRELKGEVESIGRAIYDQSVETNSGLIPDIKPNVPWVRLAQRVPVRIRLLDVPAHLPLIAGTTCTVSIQP